MNVGLLKRGVCSAYLKTCVFKPETNPTTKLGLIFAVRDIYNDRNANIILLMSNYYIII